MLSSIDVEWAQVQRFSECSISLKSRQRHTYHCAFDSIPHPFIRLALLRLGISEDVANWFLHLLCHNTVTVRSPLAMSLPTPATVTDPTAFIDHPSSFGTAASFHQEQGIGQDDTPSAIFWGVLYDILLYMLDTPPTTDSGHFLARGSLGTREAFHMLMTYALRQDLSLCVSPKQT